MGHTRSASSHIGRLQPILRPARPDIPMDVGPFPSRLTPLLWRLRRSIHVLLRSSKSSRKLVQLHPQQSTQRQQTPQCHLPGTRMDDLHRSTLSTENGTTNRHHLHHPRHKHRQINSRQQQTPLRLPLGIQRRTDGTRTQYGVQTLTRKTNSRIHRLLHHSQRHHSTRMPTTPRHTSRCRAHQRI